jgi:putative ABC transport system ATP-binding protein
MRKGSRIGWPRSASVHWPLVAESVRQVPALLELHGVSKRYRDGQRERWVLRDVDLSFERGATVAITGPSGCGKTTLLNLVAGMLRPDGGEIVFRDDDAAPLRLSALPERARAAYRRRYVGYVFQFFNLVPTLTVAENLRLPLELSGRRTLLTEALARLDALGLGDRADAFPAQLSGGEQQRVAIARALAHRPRLLLADEPTGNLDPVTSWEIIQLLIQINELGTTVLMATHNQEIVNAMRRRVLALEHGHLVRDEASAAYEREY